MTDIVERLRPLAGLDAYYAEALAEIERLRDGGGMKTLDRTDHRDLRIAELLKEIEGLREENERLVELVQTTLQASTDQIERLREEIEWLRETLGLKSHETPAS